MHELSVKWSIQVGPALPPSGEYIHRATMINLELILWVELTIQTDPRERAIVLFLRDERIRQGISATALAAKIGIDRSTINRMEDGAFRPGLWVILKLCDGLGLNLGDVVTRI